MIISSQHSIGYVIMKREGIKMVEPCPYCSGPMLHKYVIGGESGLFLHDHVPRLSCLRCERLPSSVSAYECKDCEIILIDRNDPPTRFQKMMKCPYCSKNHSYSDKDLNPESMVLCKSCLREFIFKLNETG